MTVTQKFKGDDFELQMEAAGQPPFDLCSQALDAFFDGCYESSDFLLMLYDADRMPFSDRVPRDSFVSFIKQQIPNARVTGTFESYLFILKAIFGALSEVQFEIPAPGKLALVVNVSDSLEFDFHGRELVSGEIETFEVVTSDGEVLQFRGISGIDSEAELQQLLAELIPAGIFPDITLTFFTLSYFGAEDSLGNIDTIVDHLDNQIVFYETGE